MSYQEWSMRARRVRPLLGYPDFGATGGRILFDKLTAWAAMAKERKTDFDFP